jgi:hypothetical protein
MPVHAVRLRIGAQSHRVAANGPISFEPWHAIGDRAARNLQSLGKLGHAHSGVGAEQTDQPLIHVVHFVHFDK